MSEQNVEEPKVVAREARFVIHVPARNGLPDLHLVKENLSMSDGTTRPNLRWIKDMKRSFYVTLPHKQTYKQKKEIEDLENLMKIECTQSELRDKIAAAIGQSYSNDQIRKLCNSPYIYGSEIKSTAIIKHHYQKQNKTHITRYSVMTFDIETDMLRGTNDPIIVTAAFNNEVFIAVDQTYLNGISNAEMMFKARARELLSNLEMPNFKINDKPVVLNISDYKINFVVTDGPVQLIKKSFEWIHQKKPDFLSIWNMDFDIPRILETLEKYNVDPASVLCDPSVPPPARICKYRQGLKKKKKANGQEFPIDPADQWHSLTLTASFYVIDAMCTYRLLRLAKQKESSYSLDAILDKELGVRKLKFKEADAYVKERWHIFMQERYKIEYMVYALFDSLSMILLDQKTMDINFKLPGYAGITEFARCNSKPKMIADALHYYALQNRVVLNSIGEQDEYMETDIGEDEENEDNLVINTEDIDSTDLKPEEEARVLSLIDWIVTLPAHLVVPGLPLIKESDFILTKIRAFVYDSDCVSAYPTATSILNVSKSTTKRELIAIKGIEERVFRLQNINLCSGYVNSLEYGNQMFGLPSLVELEEYF